MRASQKPIVVVGSINLDLVATTARIPAAGETVLGSEFQMHPGGKGANQAVAVARLGYPVQMIGKIGSDALGDPLWGHLQKEGVGLEGVQRSAERVHWYGHSHVECQQEEQDASLTDQMGGDRMDDVR